jgi:hypothetical protein
MPTENDGIVLNIVRRCKLCQTPLEMVDLETGDVYGYGYIFICGESVCINCMPVIGLNPVPLFHQAGLSQVTGVN